MNRISVWFFLVFLWCLTLFGVVGVVSAAEKDETSSPAKNSKPAAITFSREPEDSGYLVFEGVTPIASRLPSFEANPSDFATNISYLPANITYKTKSDIEQNEPRMLQDSLQDIEGAIFYDQVGNGLDTTFGLRGFNQGSDVIVLVDGVRVNELDGDAVIYPLIPMNDVESIQVDRGSASEIYGSGAFAGVVHVNTRRPSSKPVSLFGGMELSSFKGIKFNQGMSGSIQDRISPFGGKFTYYFNGGRDLNDGFRSNGEWRITNFDIKAGYELPDQNGSIQVGVKHIEDAISNPGTLTIPEYHADSGQSKNPLDGRKYKNTIVQINADKIFLDHRLIASILADWRINRNTFFTTSRTFPDAFNPDTDFLVTNSRVSDLIWQLSYRDSWRWLGSESQIGMEMRNGSEYDSEQDAFFGAVNETLPRETERFAKPHSMGLFWRETISFFNRVIIYGGMRHDFDWLRTRDYLDPTSNLSRRWNDSSLSTGITLKPVHFMDLFGNYSQGFRVPTISDIAPFSSGIATDLNPEKTNSYETGLRLRYKDLARAKISFFLIDLANEIVFDETSITPGTPFGRNINIGKSRRTGVENRLDLTPFRELGVYGSYTWMKAYVRKTAGSGVPFNGSDLGLIPRNRFTMGAILKPLARLGLPYSGFKISMDGVYTGRQFIQSRESTAQSLIDITGETIDPYMIWDGTVSFEWKGKQIYFKINNLFDRQYYSRAVAATNFGSNITAPGTSLFVNPGASREFLLGMKWEFGD